MTQFDYLARKHDKALGLFAKVTSKLLKLEQQISDLMTRTSESIEEANRKIEEEKKALQYLNDRLTQTKHSREKIDALTGGKSAETSRLF
jgi:phage-related tail protein